LIVLALDNTVQESTTFFSDSPKNFAVPYTEKNNYKTALVKHLAYGRVIASNLLERDRSFFLLYILKLQRLYFELQNWSPGIGALRK